MLSEEKESHVSLDVTHLDDFRLASQSSEVAVMLLHGAHHYIKKPNKSPALDSALFYNEGLWLLGRLLEIYDMMYRGDVATFVLFMDTSLKVTHSMLQRVSFGLRNNLRLVESGGGDDRSKMCGRSIKQEIASYAHVKRHFYPMDRPKSGDYTGNVGQDVGRDMEERHRRK